MFDYGDGTNELVGELQVTYFSHARENMKTDITHIIMDGNQQVYTFPL